MELTITTATGKTSKKTVEVDSVAFDRAANDTLVHQVVTTYIAGARQATKAQKTRSEVRGGGSKPWRQKGTGRARAGTIRSPLWRGGGVTFAAKPGARERKLNKKMYRAGMASIVSQLNREGRLVIVESLSVDAPKTRDVQEKLNKLGLGSALLVTAEDDVNLALGARNLPGVDVATATDVDPVSLLRFDKVCLTVDAVKKLEERLV